MARCQRMSRDCQLPVAGQYLAWFWRRYLASLRVPSSALTGEAALTTRVASSANSCRTPSTAVTSGARFNVTPECAMTNGEL
jgi:hypothetical protein